ncbi:hypothetical protein LY78DRAFT_673625 [Colletotrichum sublineola]|nr:hypothetical protein LY78DRAFT_673625 [Colletotrichum sublineola]
MPVLSVNNIGAVTQRLSGTIVGESVEALPDSGSEPNLLSLDYVIRRGFDKLMNTNDLRMIQFADGTVQKTMGSVWLNWAYADSLGDDGDDEWSEHFVEFHVLDRCACDVIIGQDALEDADAFITHEGSFMDLDIDSEPSGLNLVTWASNGHRGKSLNAVQKKSANTDRYPTGLNEKLQLLEKKNANASMTWFITYCQPRMSALKVTAAISQATLLSEREDDWVFAFGARIHDSRVPS